MYDVKIYGRTGCPHCFFTERKMQDVKDTTTHTIDLSLTKKAGIWTVDELSSDDISKLHGLY